VGGRFATINSVVSNNIAYWEDGKWYTFGNGLYDLDVCAIAYNELLGTILVDGARRGTTLTHQIVQWVFHGENQTEWYDVQGKILDWDGIVNVIQIQYFEIEKEWTWAEISVIVVVCTVALVMILFSVLGLIFWIRERRRNNLLNRIPELYRKKGNLTLKKILQDPDIRHIPYKELKFGQRLGVGASGVVVAARWKENDVAVKQMKISRNKLRLSNKFISDFLLEIKLLSSLSHPNVIHCLGISTSGDNELLLVTELMAHGSIRDFLDTHEDIDLETRLKLALGAARGMRYLNNLNPPVIHRDLKSENLLVSEDLTCKVSDFGIFTIKSQFDCTMTSNIGTPVYMAPEVINQRAYTPKVDVYSFGILLVEIYTGTRPYSSESFAEMFPSDIMRAVVHEGLRPEIPQDCPTELTQLIRECLNSIPDLRPTFKEIVSRLERLILTLSSHRSLKSPSVF